MSFETSSLLLNWMEMGVLLAILFRLSYTFELIANTQRELRRAIHHLGDRRAPQPGINSGFDEPGIARWQRADSQSTMDADDLLGNRPEIGDLRAM
jgi:hypothetical protein